MRRRELDSIMQLGGGLGAALAPLFLALGLYAFAPNTILNLFFNLGFWPSMVTLYLGALSVSILGRFIGFLGGYAITVKNRGVHGQHRSDWQAFKAALLYAFLGNAGANKLLATIFTSQPLGLFFEIQPAVNPEVLDDKPTEGKQVSHAERFNAYLNSIKKDSEQYKRLQTYSHSIVTALESLRSIIPAKFYRLGRYSDFYYCEYTDDTIYERERVPNPYEPLALDLEQFERIVNYAAKAESLTKAIKLLEKFSLTHGEAGKSNLYSLVNCLPAIDQIIPKLSVKEPFQLEQRNFDKIIEEQYRIAVTETNMGLETHLSGVVIGYLTSPRTAEDVIDICGREIYENLYVFLEEINCGIYLSEFKFEKFDSKSDFRKLNALLTELRFTEVFTKKPKITKKKFCDDESAPPSNEKILDQIISKKKTSYIYPRSYCKAH